MGLKRKHKQKTAGTEFVSQRQEIRESSKISAKDLLGGSLLSREVVLKQVPFVLFLFAMLLFYIANQYRGDKVMRETMALEEKVRELRAKSAALSFRRQELSKQSEVIKLVREKQLPLEEALIPPYKIIIND